MIILFRIVIHHSSRERRLPYGTKGGKGKEGLALWEGFSNLIVLFTESHPFKNFYVELFLSRLDNLCQIGKRGMPGYRIFAPLSKDLQSVSSKKAFLKNDLTKKLNRLYLLKNSQSNDFLLNSFIQLSSKRSRFFS